MTIVEPKADKLLKKYGFTPDDLINDNAWLAKKVTRQNQAKEVHSYKDEADASIHEYFDLLKEAAKDADPTILPVYEKYLKQMKAIVSQAEDLLTRRQAQKNELIHLQLQQLKAMLYPERGPQERKHTVLHYLIQYGPDFFARLKTRVRDIQKFRGQPESCHPD